MRRACYELWADYIHQKNSGSSERNIAKIQVKSVGSLGKDVFEQCTLTRSETVSLSICKNASKFVFLQAFSSIKTIQPKVWVKTLPNNKNRLLPVDVCRSKTFLLKLTNSTTKWPHPAQSKQVEFWTAWVEMSPFWVQHCWGGGRDKEGFKWWTQSQSKICH